MTNPTQQMEDDMNTTDKTDTSFPYVLATSTLAAIVSLAAVWTATALGPVAGF